MSRGRHGRGGEGDGGATYRRAAEAGAAEAVLRRRHRRGRLLTRKLLLRSCGWAAARNRMENAPQCDNQSTRPF